jgi:hypothetical protein
MALWHKGLWHKSRVVNVLVFLMVDSEMVPIDALSQGHQVMWYNISWNLVSALLSRK